jgi:ADP-ribosylglycohydrolase
MTNLTTNIHPVLAAACLGDALGASTEGMQRNEIIAVFGSPVTRFQPAPEKAPFAAGMEAGRLTDDATQMLAMADVLVRTGGRPSADDAAAGLLAWASDADVFRRFAGPTTRLAVERIRAGHALAAVATPETYSCSFGASDGAAMRAPAAGLVNPGKPEAAVELAAILSVPTHNTQIAFAGAGAVAAAIATGLSAGEGSDLGAAALKGARLGEALGPKLGRVVGGASVVRRLEVALEIAGRYRGDPDAAMVALEAEVGNGVAMAEAAPTAIALAVSAAGDPWAAIVAGVNGGNDSDTIAMIAGAVAAAWADADWIPSELVAELERVNRLDLVAVSRNLAGVADRTDGVAGR